MLDINFIGATTTAIFTLVNSVLLKPLLPYPDSDRPLVWIWNLAPRSGYRFNELIRAGFSRKSRPQLQMFLSVGGLSRTSWNVTGAGEAQRLSGVLVTHGALRNPGQVRTPFARPHVHGRTKYHVRPRRGTGGLQLPFLASTLWRRSVGSRAAASAWMGRRMKSSGIMPPGFGRSPTNTMCGRRSRRRTSF